MDVKTLKFKTVQSFGINGAMSITSVFQVTLSTHLNISKMEFSDDAERKVDSELLQFSLQLTDTLKSGHL